MNENTSKPVADERCFHNAMCAKKTKTITFGISLSLPLSLSLSLARARARALCMCVCVCVWKRERESVRACVCDSPPSLSLSLRVRVRAIVRACVRVRVCVIHLFVISVRHERFLCPLCVGPQPAWTDFRATRPSSHVWHGLTWGAGVWGRIQTGRQRGADFERRYVNCRKCSEKGRPHIPDSETESVSSFLFFKLSNTILDLASSSSLAYRIGVGTAHWRPTVPFF